MTQENDEPPAGPAGPYTLEQHAAWTEAHQNRKSQVGIYHGIGPEPKRSSGRWEDWIETLYMACDWSLVPLDWKPGDPRDPETQAEIENCAWLRTKYEIEKAMEAARKGPAPR
jgi:hypothetical protein